MNSDRETQGAATLEQIIRQSMDKNASPAPQAKAERGPGTAGDGAPPSSAGEDTAARRQASGLTTPQAETERAPGTAGDGVPPPPAGQGPAVRRQTSVFIYLAVLFAAAFAMLLLAYFVQQRNNQTALDDLRSSMDRFHSIQDLLDENNALQTENERLEQRVDRLEKEMKSLNNARDALEEELNTTQDRFLEATQSAAGWSAVWMVEQSYLAQEYEDCAAELVLLATTYRDELHVIFPEAARDRVAEISADLVSRGILDEDWDSDPDRYQDLLSSYYTRHPILYE